MRIKRTVAAITSCVTILSLVVTYMEILSKDPQLWYILLIITPLASLVEICLLPHWRNIPVPQNRYLMKDRTDGMIAATVNPREYPLCAHLTVAHSNGTAIAALTAQTIYLNIKELQIKMVHQQVEMGNEKAYSVYVVREHLDILRCIHAILLNSVNRGNLLIGCYRTVPGADKIYRGLREVNLEFEEKIIKVLEQFLMDIPDEIKQQNEGDERLKPEIRKLITQEIPAKLAELVQSLFRLEDWAKKLSQDIEADWDRDLRFLWEDNQCKPRRENVPVKPKLAANSLPAYIDKWMESLKKRQPAQKIS